MTVYIEYVFIDNLIIDYLLFKATFTLTGNGYNKGRLLFCAFLGGVFALLYPLISAHTVIVTVIKVLFGLLIMLLANSYRTKKNFYVNTVVFFGLTFLVGGAIIGVFSLLGLEYSAEFSIAVMILPVYILIRSLTAVVKYLYRRKEVVCLTYDFEIEFLGNTVKGKGFLDTGNGLYDGDSPVIVCGKKFFQKLIDGAKQLPKIGKIELSTVTGKDQSFCVKLNYLKIYIDGRENIFNNVTLALAKKGIGDDYDVILHPALKENNYVKCDKDKTEKVS